MSIEDIEHAVEHPLFVDADFQSADPPKVLILGPDRHGNVIELVGTESGDDVIVFHAMTARPLLLRLLDPKERG